MVANTNGQYKRTSDNAPYGTRVHSVRVPDETWQAAADKAAEKGEPLSDVIRRALVRYATPVKKRA